MGLWLKYSHKNKSLSFPRFLDAQPYPIQSSFRRLQKRQTIEDGDENTAEIVESSTADDDEDAVDCTWRIHTEPGLYLLMTFHNLGAPFTVDCEGAFIEVERERNGFEARWCGNRLTTVRFVN